MLRRTRIVCTIGPASSAPAVLQKMMRAGMDVARLNFSHGTHAEHEVLLKNIRSSAKKAGKCVTILQDLQGPKIRVGALPDAGIELHVGQNITFSTVADRYEENGSIPITYKKLHHDVTKGHRILLDDGFLEVVVTSVKGKVIHAKVVHGGLLKSHKGMNLPDSTVSVDPFTEKDHVDLLFGVAHGVDWLVLSFIAKPEIAEDVRRSARAAARMHGVRAPWIMAKIETKLGVERFDEILAVVDGIMLGRGDLGLEIPMEEVPMVQKDLIERCRQAGKPIIIATHMLDSMARNPRATRAEVSDVANAVLDHTDAVMLSAESASGRYPAATVQAMAAVIDEAEKSRFDFVDAPTSDVDSPAHAMAHSVAVMASRKIIAGIVTTVAIPDVAFVLPRYRPHVPIFVACPDDDIARRIALYAGVLPFVTVAETGSFVPRMHAFLVKHRFFAARDRVAYVTGGGGTLSLSLHGG
jgi:pyruvate kinase